MQPGPQARCSADRTVHRDGLRRQRREPEKPVTEVADGRVKTSEWPGFANRRAHG